MENLILRNNIIGIGIFAISLLCIFIFSDSFMCEYGQGLYGRFCPIEKDSLMEIKFGIGIILIHLLVIFTRISPFYRSINSEKSSAILLIVLSIVSAIFLHIFLSINGDGRSFVTLFYIIIIPFSLFSFVLYTFVYSYLTRNLYFILFYGILGGLYYLVDNNTEHEIIGNLGYLGFGYVFVGMYYFIFHLLWYLFDNRDFIEK